MKYVLSFLLGVLLTSVCFIFYLKNRLVDSTTSIIATEQEIVQDDLTPGVLPNGFRKFYENFHQDSVFQLNHIRFPLEGIPEKETEQTNLNNFYWKKENWTIHGSFNSMEGSFIRDFQPIGEDIVIENIRHVEANYGMQRRFSRDGDDWYLIYYAAMNEMAKPE